jgi:hypothetical protein
VSSKSLANKLLSGFTSTRLAARKRMDDALDPNFGLSSEEKDQIATQEAQRGMESALEFAQRNAPGVHTTGQIPGGQISPNLPSPGGPAQSPQAPPAAGKTSPNSQRELIPLESLSNSPNFQRALELDKTPEGRQKLLERGIKPSSGPQSSSSPVTSGIAQGLLATNPIAGPMALGNFVGQNATEGILKLLQGGGQ